MRRRLNDLERLLKAIKYGQSSLDGFISNISKAKTDVGACALLIDSARRYNTDLKGYQTDVENLSREAHDCRRSSEDESSFASARRPHQLISGITL